ncbi:DUF1799 domain-containing protein [Acidovorax sp.]|uniref:DUF1799 domain-containing protein n=1 Tax=Acidovorax sp. TaxID=1872122 RepID=UPI002ACE210D|nr:DUF1799 domain-containing protein [Acidovorax sp.]MDZ7862678.1 DUF1799 domain-containing protein [Acidovorax sp.]
MEADFALLGVDPEGARLAAGASATSGENESGDFELWPEHQQAWEVFLDCGRQWRVIAGMGGVYFQGLEATAVESSFRIQGVPRKDWKRVRSQLMVLEDEAAEILNER